MNTRNSWLNLRFTLTFVFLLPGIVAAELQSICDIVQNRSTGQVELKIVVRAGAFYTVESSTDSQLGSWDTMIVGRAAQNGEVVIPMREGEASTQFYRVRPISESSIPLIYEMQMEHNNDGAGSNLESVLVASDAQFTFLRKTGAGGFFLIAKSSACEASFDELGRISTATLANGDVLTVSYEDSERTVKIRNRLERAVGEFTLPAEESARVPRADDSGETLTSTVMMGEMVSLLESLLVVGKGEGSPSDWSAEAEASVDILIGFEQLLSEAATHSLEALGFTPAITSAFTGSNSDENDVDASLYEMVEVGGRLWRVARTMEEALQIDGPFIYRPECLDLRNQVNAILGSLNELQQGQQSILLFEGNRHWFNGSYQALLQEMFEDSLLFIEMYESSKEEMGDYCSGEAEAFVQVMDEIDSFLNSQRSIAEGFRIADFAAYQGNRRTRDGLLALGQIDLAGQVEEQMKVSLENISEVNTAVFTLSCYCESFMELRSHVFD